ncbi:MAG TPA: hypothetical protein DCY86_14285 [Bdellovibrionales bacterium]|nr:hypothetical protein [Bdellovibrionales bacterium]
MHSLFRSASQASGSHIRDPHPKHAIIGFAKPFLSENKDAAKYVFEKGVNGVISTFAITLIPEYDTIIKNAADALAPEGRLVILDLKESQRAPHLLVKLGILITKPFGVTLDISSRHPWESVDRYLKDTSFKELYFGFAFISSGEQKRGKRTVL